MVSLMDAFYAALRIFISDAKDLPVVVHKKVSAKNKPFG